MLMIAIALLPPLEYFTQATNDPNYRQQFVLALITGLIGIILTVLGAITHKKSHIHRVGADWMFSQFHWLDTGGRADARVWTGNANRNSGDLFPYLRSEVFC